MVSTALLLDNMLFMVIVPIITQILNMGRKGKVDEPKNDWTLTLDNLGEAGPFLNETSEESEDISIGILFASKAIVQLLGTKSESKSGNKKYWPLDFVYCDFVTANTVTGTFIDRTGYELPLLMGLTVMFSSTLMFSLFTRQVKIEP